MTATPAPSDLKARHRAMWGLGDYARVADEVIPELGRVLVEACRIGPGDRVLDIAAGTGNAAVPAALAGAHVTASDLSPELLEIGQLRAARIASDSASAEHTGAADSITWRVADAEALPFDDAAFDVAMSCVGIMFAPFHEKSAAELNARPRPKGTSALRSCDSIVRLNRGSVTSTVRGFNPASSEFSRPGVRSFSTPARPPWRGSSTTMLSPPPA